MTTREFYVNVLDLIDVIVSDDPTGCVDTDAMAAKARELIASPDASNEKRRSTETKEKKEAADRRYRVQAFFETNPHEVCTRDNIAAQLSITPGQVTAACKALIEVGYLTKSEAKVDKARKVVYSKA
jgi:hypothetical protein